MSTENHKLWCKLFKLTRHSMSEFAYIQPSAPAFTFLCIWKTYSVTYKL